jgi:hypothetical protein
MEHTKGPWKVIPEIFDETEERGCFSMEIHIDNGFQPAHVFGGNREEVAANARLIAESPTMYEAIKSLMRESHCPETYDTLMDNFKAILSRIEGKE